MREILFRAWWKDGGGLVDQNAYVIRPNGTIEFPEGGWDLWGSDDSHLVVLEQFTGLHDATKWEDLTDAERDEWIKSGHTKEDWKGRRIFEGDIIEVDFDNDGPTIGKQKAFIEYSQHYTAFMVRPIKDWAFCEMTEGKVIGNIHDNPEQVEAR